MNTNRTPFVAILSLVAITHVTSICSAQDAKGRPNLLTNFNFAEGLNGWELSSWKKSGAVALDSEVKRGDTPSIRITNVSADDSFCKQIVKVKPGMRYRLSGYIKTKDVEVKGGQAATLSLEGGFESTETVKGTKSWQKFDFEFDSGALDTVKVGPRLGGHSSMATGVAWYDDLRLIELGKSRR